MCKIFNMEHVSLYKNNNFKNFLGAKRARTFAACNNNYNNDHILFSRDKNLLN